jgi:hypothetical protein
MNLFALDKPPLDTPLKTRHPACRDLITMAEQEFAAFFSAVT